MTFIRMTDGGYVNLDRVTLFGQAEPGPDAGQRHKVFCEDDCETAVGFVSAYRLDNLLVDLIPAPPLWRLLRAGQDEDAMWHIVSDLPVIAFGRSLEGLWEPIPADFETDLGNPCCIKHQPESWVIDLKNCSRHDTALSWLEDLQERSEAGQ